MRLSITRRGLQISLGLLWLLDGGLQFQSYMYSRGFTDSLIEMTPGQPGWLGSSIKWAAHLASHNPSVWNTLFALVQVLIGIGLLYRPTVKPALAVSFVWVFVVWWFGEAFGMLFMNMAEPLTGAPGAALLYAIIGMLVWPGERLAGLLDARGARTLWAALWLVIAWLWLEPPSSGPNATSTALRGAESGMGWLTGVQHWVAAGASGHGLVIAIVLAAASAAIAVGVGTGHSERQLLWLSIALNIAYWFLGQGLGSIFAGGATDLNAGPLFVLLGFTMLSIVEAEEHACAPVVRAGEHRTEIASGSLRLGSA
jgi:hypothetical protein